MVILIVKSLISCNSTGDIYSGKDGEQFFVANTEAFIIGSVLLYEASKCSGRVGGYNTSFRITLVDDDNWDYLLDSNKYRYRSKSTGQFVYQSLCADDILKDS